MSKWREEHFYLIFLIVVAVMEGCLSIPMFVPLFDGTMGNMYLIVAMTHVAGYFFLQMKMVDIRPYMLHVMGFLGLFISVLPYINFIYHLFVFYLTYKAIRKYIKFFKTLNTKAETP